SGSRRTCRFSTGGGRRCCLARGRFSWRTRAKSTSRSPSSSVRSARTSSWHWPAWPRRSFSEGRFGRFFHLAAARPPQGKPGPQAEGVSTEVESTHGGRWRERRAPKRRGLAVPFSFRIPAGHFPAGRVPPLADNRLLRRGGARRGGRPAGSRDVSR